MNVRQIEVFRAVYIARSVSGGARQLNVSQPAVSRLVRHLEDQLGYSLFATQRGRTVPTVQADLLFRETEGLTEHMRRVVGVAHSLRGGAGERLSVLSFHSMSIDLVPRALEGVLRVYPGLLVSIGTKSSSDQIADVMRMTADVGIAGNLPEMAEIETISLGMDSIVAVMRADLPIARAPVVRFADLATVPLVSSPIDSPIGTKLQEGFARHGQVFRPAVEAAAPTPIMQLVRRLGQIGLVGVRAVDSLRDMDGLVLRPLETPVEYEMQAFWNRNSAPSPARDLFVQKLAAAYANSSPARPAPTTPVPR